MTDVKIAQIVAIAATSRAIGKDNQLLWHVPGDLKHFKQTTIGKPIIMGRKTYDSVGFPLPGRLNIVVSRDPSLVISGVTVVPNIEAALDVGMAACRAKGIDELMIAGGAEIYRQSLSQTDRIYLTEIGLDIDGDSHYPALSNSDWILREKTECPSVDGVPDYCIKIFERR